jgi:hypothetical protein
MKSMSIVDGQGILAPVFADLLEDSWRVTALITCVR